MYLGFLSLRTQATDLLATRKTLPKAWRYRVCRPSKPGSWLAEWKPDQACKPKKIVVKYPSPGPTRKILPGAWGLEASGSRLGGRLAAGWLEARPGLQARSLGASWGVADWLLLGPGV